MFRRRPESRRSSHLTSRATGSKRRASARLARAVCAAETMESRVLFSAAFDITSLTAMRNDPTFSSITGQGIGIAILDTGVYAQNPDLKANVKAFYNAVQNPVNAPFDTNFLTDSVDNEGHGSHVSGIAASSNPSIGVAYNASLYDVKVLPDTALGETEQAGDALHNGLRWVLANATKFNIKVVNMSLGFETNINSAPALDIYGQDIQALQNIGVTVIAASGNGYANYAAPGEDILAAQATIGVANTWPDNGAGHYNFTGIYGSGQFGAFETSATPDTLQATSQRSSLFNQVAAPGTGIYSTWNSPTQLHNTISGTSMASPFVAGVTALMQQAAQKFGGQYLAPQTILQILRNTADVIQDPVNVSTNGRVTSNPDGSLATLPLPGTGLTYDRINVLHAIEAVKTLVQGGAIPSDANKTLATAVNISPLNGKNSDVITGSIGFDGNVSLGVNDVDIYKVVVQTPGTLTITSQAPAGGVQFNLSMKLFDGAGNVVFSAPGGNGTPYPTILSAVGVPLQAGTYYLGAASSGNNYNQTTGAVGGGQTTGDYQINFTVTSPDPGGVPAAAETLGLTSPNTLSLPLSSNNSNLPYTATAGTLGQETLEDGTVVNVVNGDVHFYTIVAPDTGNLLLQATATSQVVFNPNDAFIRAFDVNGNPVGTSGTNISVPVVSGQIYYIGVTTQANQNFQPNDPFTRVANSTPTAEPFTLYSAFDNGDRNGTIAQATSETIGSPVSGTIGSDPAATFLGANGGNKDVDFYTFTSPTSGVFQGTVTGSTGLNPQVSLWRTDSGISSVTKLLSIGTSGSVYQQVTAGQTIILAVTGLGNQGFNGISLGSGAGGTVGTYTITSSVQPATLLATLSNNSISNATPTPVTLGTAAPGNIGLDGSLYVGATDVDFYKFVAPSSREYRFSTSTSQENSADTVMRIFDGLGNQVAVNDNADATTTASSISLSMTANQTYYIGISGAGPGALSYAPLTGTGTSAGRTGPYSFQVNDIGAFQRTENFSQGSNLSFKDATGHKVTLRLTGPGIGSVVFFSVSGNDNIGKLVLTGTDATTNVTLTGATPIGQVTVTNALGDFNARQARLTGNFTDANGLKSLSLDSATGGTISIGHGVPTTIKIGTLTNVNLTSTSQLKSVRATTWNSTGVTRSVLSAPSIMDLRVSGTFNEDVSATTIKRFTVGTLTASAIRASSSIDTFTAGTATGSKIFAGIDSSVTGLPTSATQFKPGSIKTLTVHGVFSNTQVAAFNIQKVNIGALQPTNGGTQFGIATNRLKNGRIIVNGTPHILNNVFAPLAPISLTGDAVVELVG